LDIVSAFTINTIYLADTTSEHFHNCIPPLIARPKETKILLPKEITFLGRRDIA